MMKSKKNSMKIMHLSNIAGKLGGGVSQVVHALLKNQNLMNTNTHLWFFGSAKISSEVAKETQVDQKKINPLGKGWKYLNSCVSLPKFRLLPGREKDKEIPLLVPLVGNNPRSSVILLHETEAL